MPISGHCARAGPRRAAPRSVGVSDSVYRFVNETLNEILFTRRRRCHPEWGPRASKPALECAVGRPDDIKSPLYDRPAAVRPD
ncbi:hypothetical protein EVAR_44349_1 [Eumeta japonica]|uniref:Uncharacterized protein n=1 Tax=Eumeta variegata TaxID=151549 RepID=A0A4C1X9S1_EUMVA|nr:hypothetical protein EVAR_44349_1 [Eumeta japonica]